jgi:hypothetical protein
MPDQPMAWLLDDRILGTSAIPGPALYLHTVTPRNCCASLRRVPGEPVGASTTLQDPRLSLDIQFRQALSAVT